MGSQSKSEKPSSSVRLKRHQQFGWLEGGQRSCRSSSRFQGRSRDSFSARAKSSPWTPPLLSFLIRDGLSCATDGASKNPQVSIALAVAQRSRPATSQRGSDSRICASAEAAL